MDFLIEGRPETYRKYLIAFLLQMHSRLGPAPGKNRSRSSVSAGICEHSSSNIYTRADLMGHAISDLPAVPNAARRAPSVLTHFCYFTASMIIVLIIIVIIIIIVIKHNYYINKGLFL